MKKKMDEWRKEGRKTSKKELRNERKLGKWKNTERKRRRERKEKEVKERRMKERKKD